MWDLIESIAKPSMSISEPLIPLYNRLTQLYEKLEHVQNQFYFDNDFKEMSSNVQSVQDELQEIESKMVDGVFLPGKTSKVLENIPEGQAVFNVFI